MSYSFDILSRTIVRAMNQDNLTSHQKNVLSQVLEVVEAMHSANHRLKDAINKDVGVGLAARRLTIVVDTPDPELQRKKLLQTYETGAKP